MDEKDKKKRRQFDRLVRKDEIQIKEYSYPERGNYQSARIIDISGGGLQIECSRFFSSGIQLKVLMNFTGWQQYTSGFLKYFGNAANQPLIVLAEVVRCESVVPGHKYKMAVKFSGIDESQRRALIRFIREQLLLSN